MTRYKAFPILLAIAIAAPASAEFDLSWNTIDAGGATICTGGPYALGGTLGQPDAGVATGGTFALSGGFWSIRNHALLPADMNCDGAVNNFDIDPFVLALVDPSAYTTAYANCDIRNGDVNRDQRFDNFDLDPFVACIINFGCR